MTYAEQCARTRQIAASLHPDLLRLSPTLLIRDVMQVKGVSYTTARTAVLLAGSSRNPRNSQHTNEGETK